MVADRHSMKLHALGVWLLSGLPHFDQRKIGSSPADVTHQNRMPGGYQLGPILIVFVDPRVKCRLRFFDQHDIGQFGDGCRLDRQLASNFVERCGQRDHDVLIGQPFGLEFRIPGVADMPQVAGTGVHGRQSIDVGSAMPGQKFGGSVDAGMAQPRFGGSN